jgi:hypothetical protein
LIDVQSSTPELDNHPTWTQAKPAIDSPVLAVLPPDSSQSINENPTLSTADLEGRVSITKQDGSSTAEDDMVNADAGYNYLGAEVQIHDFDDYPSISPMEPLFSQTQVSSNITTSTSTEQFLIKALPPDDGISNLFTPEIQYWEEHILAWGEEYGLDPNLIATVMQIESCGYTKAKSVAGAMGLFQVMPQHFEKKEDPYDPDTNANKGLSWLQRTLKSGGSIEMALAGYNAGIARAKNPYLEWSNETERYVNWGSRIYHDTKSGYRYSAALHHWLYKGGASLCNKAAVAQQDK